ncbi:hypothetical protein F751_6307 [Auxenochlorella protothecoides]|uniref:Integral membrane bound transporter domain-containing protein n=1 Tax=Auxenochlorella protothecoides TaxID=3075 RepID=A0A087SST2_AUXPR|nr:hypothetical protein F751_6307 [Auxenochlorella protothecoides]KFM28786.1 hypothetical protein F751_6307 [Auxenochlorella protothecoides]
MTLQMGASTFLVMAIFSYPGIWRKFTVTQEFVNPMLICFWLALLFCVRPMSRQGMFRLGAIFLLASSAGVGLALASLYLIVAIMGGSNDNSAVKLVVTLLISCPVIYCLAVYRVMRPSQKFPGLIVLIFYALIACGAYRTPVDLLPQFPRYLLFYTCVAVAITWATTFLIAPTPAGLLARMALANGLRATAGVLADILDLTLEKLNEEGKLAAASGTGDSGALNIDSGLYPRVISIHMASYNSGKRITAAREHSSSARLELDLYRPTHVLAFRPFWKASLLARSLLSAVTAGQLRLSMVHAHADLFARVRDNARVSLCRAAACLTDNAPIEDGLQALGDLHGALCCLILAFQRLPKELALTPDSMAFHIMATNVLTSATQIRKIYQVLPAVLAKDQPQSGKAVRSFLLAYPAADMAKVAYTPAPANEAAGREALGALQASLIHRGSTVRRSAIGLDEFLLSLGTGEELPGMRERLQRRSVARVEPVPALPPGRWDRLMGGLTVRTGITPLHLRIACQTAASYGLVMVLTGVDASYLALWERPIWAMLTTISVAETSIGAVYKKGSLRVVGTVVGMALGLATLYLAVLINGLNHDNHPAKFIVTTICLTCISAVGATCCAWDPGNTFAYMAGFFCLFGSALPGYIGDQVFWNYGLLRSLMTVLGVLIHMLVAQVVFPVSSRQTARGLMAASLGALAGQGAAMLRRLLVAAWNQFRIEAGPGVISEDPRPVGPVFLDLYKTIWPAATKIAGMAPLVDALAFEYELFHVPHRLPVRSAFKAQRLFRHILNTLSTFANSMDAQRLSHLALLEHESEQVACLGEQMRQSLLGMQGMLQGRVAVADALRSIEALDYHTEGLFLHFLTDQLAGSSETTLVVQTLALISLLFNLTWVLRRLSINLIYTFWGQKSPEARLAESFFADPLRWAIDEDLIFAAQAALGVSLASAPDASLNHADDSVDGEAAGPDPTGPGSKEPPGLPGTALPGYYIRSSADLLTLANSSRVLNHDAVDGRGASQAVMPLLPAGSLQRLPEEGGDSSTQNA